MLRPTVKRILFRLGICMILIGLSLVVSAQEFDQYGGWTGLKGHNTSGYFRVEKINGRYWLVTPENNVFWSIGHCVTQYNDTWGGYCPVLGYYPNPYGNKAKYNGNYAAWKDAVKARNVAWGFNTVAAWGVSDISGYPECVRVLFITSHAQAIGCRMVDDGFADVFDPKFAQACDDRAKTLASNATNPWTIGSFPDNELHWANPRGYKTLPEAYIAFPPEAYGKQYWVNTFLKSKYSTIASLNAAYGTNFTDWTGDGNTVINCTSLPDDSNWPARLNDKIDFNEVIADKYYQLTTSKMRQYDSNHLVFSARWAMWWQGYASEYHRPFNERVWKKAGQYCDVFANNGYADFGYAETMYQHSTRVFMNAKKPFMITEHSYLGNDSYFRDTPGWLPTQMDRAIYHVNHLKTIMDLGVSADPNDGQPAKTCMGLHWFQYYDEPSLGRPDGEAGQFGLLNVKDEAFLPLVEVMSTAHSQIYSYLGLGQPVVVPEAPTAVRPIAASLQVAERASSFEYVRYPDDGLWGHSTGSLVDDAAATKGKAWKATAGTGSGNYMQYGPYVAGSAMWPSAVCKVSFRLKTSNNTTTSWVASIDVTTNNGSTVHASRSLKGTDFTAANVYQDFSLTFTTPAAPVPDRWEYRVQFGGAADVWVDTTTVSITPPSGWVLGPISDGNSSTIWSSQGYTSPEAQEWVAIDLGSVRSGIRSLVMTPGTASASGRPIDFRLEYSSNGFSWTTISGQVYTNFTPGLGAVTFTFQPLSARYLRVYATKLGADECGKYRLQLAGLDIRSFVETAKPTFEWTAVPGAVSYVLLYSQEQGFPEEQTIRVSGISGTSYTPGTSLSPGPWYWTVKAVDAQGRGGHYLKTVQFFIGNLPDSEVDAYQNLRCDEVTAWFVTDNSVTGGDGTVWVYRDTSRKVEGDASARVVFTVNSLNKTTGLKNTGVTNIPWRWVGPTLDYSGVGVLSFKLYPQRFTDTSGTIILPSKYLYFKMTDANAGVVVDVPVDASGTLPKDIWSTVEISLGAGIRTHVTGIEFYVKCGDAKLTWDERMIFNIDDITPGVMRDGTPPTRPVVRDCGDYSAPLDRLSASWSAEDAESGITEYSYAIGTAPGASDVVGWTSAGTSTSVMRTGLSLTTGASYYFSVQAKNGEALWSEAGSSDGVTALPSLNLGGVHNNPDGASVQIASGIVTVGSDRFMSTSYVEAADRSSGIRLYGSSLSARAGDVVRVSGTIQTIGGERVITYPVVTTYASGKPVPRPLLLVARSVGGEAPNAYTPGVTGSYGLYDIGLLVTVFGRVTAVDTIAKYFYIDDGCTRADGSGNTGLRVSCSGLASGNTITYPPKDSLVLVTGIASTQLLSGNIIPALRPRSSSDIVVFTL